MRGCGRGIIEGEGDDDNRHRRDGDDDEDDVIIEDPLNATNTTDNIEVERGLGYCKYTATTTNEKEKKVRTYFVARKLHQKKKFIPSP